MIPIPTSLSVSVATDSKNSPCICCCTNVQYQVNETNTTNNPPQGDQKASDGKKTEDGEKRVLPTIPDEAKKTCVSFFGRMIDRIIPGHHQRESEKAATLFLDFLEKKYGESIARSTVEGENWDEIKNDLRVKHVQSLQLKAEKLSIDTKIIEAAKETSSNVDQVSWVVKYDNWSPEIEVEKTSRRGGNQAITEPFDAKKIKNKLQRLTRATETQEDSVVDGIKEQIFHSNQASVIISSEDLDSFLIQEIADKQLVLKTLDQFSVVGSTGKGEVSLVDRPPA